MRSKNARPLERSACIGSPTLPVSPTLGGDEAKVAGCVGKAVEIATSMWDNLAFAKEPYLDPRRMPLAQAVVLDEA